MHYYGRRGRWRGRGSWGMHVVGSPSQTRPDPVAGVVIGGRLRACLRCVVVESIARGGFLLPVDRIAGQPQAPPIVVAAAPIV